MKHAVALLVMLAGCIEPDLLACPDSTLCAPDLVCDSVHGGCVTATQISVCAAEAPSAACNASGIVGYCIDGVCLPSRCGDGLLEPPEVCDDGNTRAGDGCDATCASNETCGNAIVDLGEECDDANTLASDGCDSLCDTETESWSVSLLGIQYGGAGKTTYDEAHHRSIHVDDGVTGSWDGTRWHLIAAAGPPSFAEHQLAFDPDHGTVLLAGIRSSTSAIEIWKLDGDVWTREVIQTSPSLTRFRAVYDRARHTMLVIGYAGAQLALWALDPVTWTWTQLATPTLSSGGGLVLFGAAYDETRNVTVVAMPTQSTPTTAEWNGTSWSYTSAAMPAPNGWTLSYDPELAAVVAIGGGFTIVKWTGSGWPQVEGTLVSSSDPDVWYDRDRQRRTLIESTSHITEWNVLVESEVTPFGQQFADFYDIEYAYDQRRHLLVQYGTGSNAGIQGGTVTLGFDGVSWRLLSFAPISSSVYPSPAAIAYDPARAATVLVTQQRGTYLLHDDAWTELEAPGTAATAGMAVMGYDPARRAMVGLGLQGGTYVLPSDASHWSLLTSISPVGGSGGTLAFDARANKLMLSTYFSGATWQLDGATWVESLAAGREHTVAANPSRGSVSLLSAKPDHWEHVGNVWIEHAPPPLPVVGVSFSVPERGELDVIGMDGHNRVLMRHAYVGTSALETCAGNDEDADQRVDCADPDCWWSCTPACPPYASCP